MQHFPLSFTAGEALLVSQGATALAATAAHSSALLASTLNASTSRLPEAEAVSLFVKMLLLGTAVVWCLSTPSVLALGRAHALSKPPPTRHVITLGLVATAGASVALWPAMWAVKFAFASQQRCFLMVFWVLILSVSVMAIAKAASHTELPNIVVRKLYHILAVAIFLPGLLFEQHLLAVASAIAFAAIAALELIRIGRIPPLGSKLNKFMHTFTDSRDKGVLLVSHFSLLVGVALPVWLMLDNPQSSGEAFSGILVLGVMDTAASVVGIKFGCTPVHSGARKTAEGLLGGILCTLAAWCVLLAAGVPPQLTAAGIAASTAATGLLEAVTTQMDNLFLPLYYLTLLTTCARVLQ
mmetsp:Transcript_15123/g.42381  ORF Transcript_15123/g.42381 Transcript_15123/m.42381 type:complete len:354 (+) Transcript_15123:76-1137(+)